MPGITAVLFAFAQAVAPVAPVAPVGPVAPVARFASVPPLTPDTPVARVALVAPAARFAPVAPLAQDTPVARPRPRAIEYSDLYYTRLKIHRIASFGILPVFAGQYVVGQRLANGSGSDALRGVHGALAAATIGLFGLNTVTGVWNLYDSRQDPSGRTRRIVHSLAMLAADAGFAATAALTPEHEGERRFGGNTSFREGGGVSTATHRGLAIGSGSLALAASAMMWIWK